MFHISSCICTAIHVLCALTNAILILSSLLHVGLPFRFRHKNFVCISYLSLAVIAVLDLLYLTPCRRFLLEKLIVYKFSVFYGTRTFMTVFTKAHPVSLRPILILSPRPHLGLPSVFFPSNFPIKILSTFLISTMRATYPT